MKRSEKLLAWAGWWCLLGVVAASFTVWTWVTYAIIVSCAALAMVFLLWSAALVRRGK